MHEASGELVGIDLGFIGCGGQVVHHGRNSVAWPREFRSVRCADQSALSASQRMVRTADPTGLVKPRRGPDREEQDYTAR